VVKTEFWSYMGQSFGWRVRLSETSTCGGYVSLASESQTPARNWTPVTRVVHLNLVIHEERNIIGWYGSTFLCDIAKHWAEEALSHLLRPSALLDILLYPIYSPTTPLP
jgi:hypothetical protein